MTGPVDIPEPPKGRPLIRAAAAPQAAWDGRFFEAVMDAEALRGNPGGWTFGDYQVAEASILFRGPIDAKALRAQFELDDGMEIRPENGAGIVYRDSRGEIALTLHGVDRPRTATMVAARDAWWHEWRAKPRPLVVLYNPFVHPDALPPLAPRPAVLTPAPARLVLDRYMSSQLPGLGEGWSVWPFTGPDGAGLLAVAPKWFDLASAGHAIQNAGGADRPVVVVVRGQEPPAVALALREAGADLTRLR